MPMGPWRRGIVAGCLAALSALCLASLGGCVRGQAAEAPLRFSIWGSYDEWRMWQEIVAGFEQRHPQVKVKIDYWPGNYEHKLKLLMAADRLPDVMEMQDEPFPAYCTRDKFEDLGPYIQAAGGHRRDEFLPTSMESFQYRGRQLGVPWDGGMVLPYYNRRLLREVGLPDPPQDWTWDQFLEYCRKVTRDVDGDGNPDRFGFEVNNWWGYGQIWIWGTGGEFFTPDGKTCILNNPESVAGLRYYRDLRFRHHVAPQAAEFAGTGQGVLFMTGRLAFQYNGPWGLPFLRQTDLDWDIAHIPAGPSGRCTRVSWDGVTMSRRSTRKQDAWRLIEYILGPEGQRVVARSGRGIPARRSSAFSPDFIRPDTPQREEVFLEAIDYIRLQPINEHWNEMDAELQREMDILMLRNEDPKAVADRMTARVNKLLNGGQ